MLDKETVRALAQQGDLSAYTLYNAEVDRLPRLSYTEEGEIVARARQGQEEARQRLILNSLRWAIIMAKRLYLERHPQHADVLDLAAEANLKMVEQVDKALTANDPVAYLNTVAIHAIRVYCTYYAPMIQRPEWMSCKDLDEINPFLLPPESLDESLYDHRTMYFYEHVAAPVLDLESDEQYEQRMLYRFAPLYEAIKHRLSRQQRATIIRRFGLFGQPAETLDEIAESSHLKYDSVRDTGYLARKKLQAVLAENLPQMLRPKPVPKTETLPVKN